MNQAPTKSGFICTYKKRGTGNFFKVACPVFSKVGLMNQAPT